MTSTTNLKKLLEDVDKADHVLVRHILKAVIIRCPTWAETTKEALATDASLSQPDGQQSVDDKTQSNTKDMERSTKRTKLSDDKITSQPDREICADCGAVFRPADNKEDSKHCVYHPGWLEWDQSIGGSRPGESVTGVPGPYTFRDFRAHSKRLNKNGGLRDFSWSCCTYGAYGSGCVQKAHKA